MTATTLDHDAGWRSPGRKAVGVWLLAVALIIVGMVTLGGLTRLTGSGLSITEWHPITGVVPPLSEQSWQAEFAKYKQIPQYVRENRWMSLSDFKAIYWWEWTHRLLGRLLGVVFLLPFLWFAWTGAIARREWPRMIVLFALGGLQGFVGWWMVESGLETRVAVSQYRLAIHLGTAIVLLGAILWTALEYRRAAPSVAHSVRATSPMPAARGRKETAITFLPRAKHGGGGTTRSVVTERAFAFAFVALVYIQMLLGALVAGLHAGLVYNTWPSMDGRVFPEHPFFSQPWWINFTENAGLAQFDHRIGAYLVFAGTIALWVQSRRAGLARASAAAVLGVTLFQVVLGIATLLNQAPLALAALHQVTAAMLFCAAVWHAFELNRAPATDQAPARSR